MATIYETLAEILELDVDQIDSDSPLAEYEAWDSIAALSLVIAIRTNWGVRIDAGDLQMARSASGLERLVFSKRAPVLNA